MVAMETVPMSDMIYHLIGWRPFHCCDHMTKFDLQLLSTGKTVRFQTFIDLKVFEFKYFRLSSGKILQWWFVNPGSDNPEISLIRTKSAGTYFRFWTNRRFSNPENSLIRKYLPGTNVSGLTNHHCNFFYITVQEKQTQSERAPLGACHYDLDLWPFDPKIYRCLPFFILHLCMKYEVCRWNTVWVIALQQSVDRRTDGQTDRQTDGQSDYYRAPASSMRGPNKNQKLVQIYTILQLCKALTLWHTLVMVLTSKIFFGLRVI